MFRLLFTVLIASVILMVLVALLIPSVGRAHWQVPIDPQAPPEKKIVQAKKNVRHGRTAVRWLRNNPTGTYRQWKLQVRAHRWLVRHNLNRIERLRWKTRPPHYFQWLCIHRYEGAWNDTGDPYWGGLQMDKTFMNTYAPAWLLRRGWANTWTPYEQMWVAERAYYSGRGFYPWPNTARYCGLI